ncbi:MAG: response regulator [Deltaproteobacteria bacterium]|nr:response regulator [Deltaproteobacteria bacterium]
MLVVEDDSRLVRRLCAMLSDAGVLTEVCLQLTPALARAATGGFDAALVDLGLPDGDGEQLVRALQEGMFPTASVVLSCNADMTRARSALRGGAIDYLLKPTDYETVRGALSRAVRVSRNSRAALARLAAPDGSNKLLERGSAQCGRSQTQEEVADGWFLFKDFRSTDGAAADASSKERSFGRVWISL